MTDLTNHIMQITTQRPAETELVAPKRRETFVPVFGYGDRVNMWRTITNDPDVYDDDNPGTFIRADESAYWVRIDGEEAVGRFNKRRTNGAPNWRIHKLLEVQSE